MGYQIEGRLLEVCDCDVLCPCWIGEDPDNGTCDGTLAWCIERGEIEGIDVSGLTLGATGHIPGNILHGNIRVVLVVDDGATPEQEEAILKVFTGQLGGPMADLAQLFGEIVAVERAPITFEVTGGEGFLKIGDFAEAEMTPYHGPTGEVTTLNGTIFSTIPGSPVYVAKASSYRRDGSQYGMTDVDLQGHNALQCFFRFEA
jgi:hypothetical protein